MAGGGIESSSFRYGFSHEAIDELEILLADGSTVTATRDNAHRDLFFGFANSYGSLGYALRLKARCVPAKPYVRVEHIRHRDGPAYFRDLEALCDQGVDVNILCKRHAFGVDFEDLLSRFFIWWADEDDPIRFEAEQVT